MTYQPENAVREECPAEQVLFDQRNRYFTGKYMTARDFRDEQYYFRSHDLWHQWALHGWGIVWGLKVNLDGECLTIDSGMAIDCHGRSLVLPYAVQFPISDVGEGHDILIGLRYGEFPRELVPVLLDEGCPPAHEKHNRTCEVAKIHWQHFCAKCWSFPPLHLPAPLPKPVDDEVHSLCQHQDPDDCSCHTTPVAMIPPCECEACGFVPLARLQRHGDHWVTSDLGRRYVRSPFYANALTHIVGINWHHGRQTYFDDLRLDPPDPNSPHAPHPHVSRMHSHCNGIVGRIVISFDRRLAIPHQCDPHDPLQISAYLSQLVHLDFVELDEDCNPRDLDSNEPPTTLSSRVIHLSQCHRQLYCDFPANRLHRNLPIRLRISLNCDLLIDECGRAVDGDHLGGHVPHLTQLCENETGAKGRSGNGIEGGVFYSWTNLVRRPS